MNVYRDITDEEWKRVTPLLPELRPREESRGRPLTNTRAVLNGVLWVMFSGASWSTLPRKYPSYQTCHRRFKAWHDSGVWKRVTRQLFGASSDEFYEVVRTRMRGSAGRLQAKPESAGKVARVASPKVPKRALRA